VSIKVRGVIYGGIKANDVNEGRRKSEYGGKNRAKEVGIRFLWNSGRFAYRDQSRLPMKVWIECISVRKERLCKFLY